MNCQIHHIGSICFIVLFYRKVKINTGCHGDKEGSIQTDWGTKEEINGILDLMETDWGTKEEMCGLFSAAFQKKQHV